MSRILPILFISFLCGTGMLHAQWSPKDSVWLEGILSGKDTIRLNPETQNSILKGNLINPDKAFTPLMESTPELPLFINFDEYFEAIDSAVPRKFRWADLPPSLFLRFYNPELPKELQYMSSNIFDHVRSQYFRGPQATMFFDANHLLSMALSKQYRQFESNSKKAKNLKYYNDLPSTALHKKIKNYQAAHPEKFVLKKDSVHKKNDLPLPLVTSRNKKDSIPETIPADSIWN